MPWLQLVVRPDSIIRYWATGQVKVADGYARVLDVPEIRNLRFRTNLFFSNGATMVRTEEMGSLAAALISASQDHPSLFEDLGRHFERIGDDWLAYCRATISESDLSKLSERGLLERVHEFCRYFAEFAPMLYVPFVVERRYAEAYPAMLARLVPGVRRALAEDTAGLAQLFAMIGLAPNDNPGDAELAQLVRLITEYSPRRTDAEQREEVLLRLASEVESDVELRELFDHAVPPAVGEIRLRDAFFNSISEALLEFGWMKQWGFPSHHSPSTLDDFVLEVHATLQGASPAKRLEERHNYAATLGELHRLLVDQGELESSDRMLISDVNYYNFMRTHRMELLIHAENYAGPLFDEIDRRAVSWDLIGKGATYLLMPPEIERMLIARTVPEDLSTRRGEWALQTDSDNEAILYSGPQFESFADRYLTILDGTENARGGFSNLDAKFVGGKGAGLFRLRSAGANVPPFFVVTTRAFQRTCQDSDLQDLLANPAAQGAATLDGLKATSSELEYMVGAQRISPEIKESILSAFDALGVESVAVRSSATVEDSQRYSWAGRFRSYLNVDRGAVFEAIMGVWQSLFSESALLYAADNGVDLATVSMAVVVQAMIPAEVAGVVNTNGAGADIEIEAAYGLGETVVSGTVTPDRYIVRVDGGEALVLHQTVSQQSEQLTSSGWSSVAKEAQSRPKLEADKVLELAALASRLEDHFGAALDIEWAMFGNNISLVQARPQTDLPTVAVRGDAPVPPNARLLLSGLRGKVSGVWRGPASVLASLDDGSAFRPGTALVVQAATPAWDPVVFRAGALITNEGGVTSHAIRVANERGIVVVVGTGAATEMLRSGDEVIIDAASDPLVGRVLVVDREG